MNSIDSLTGNTKAFAEACCDSTVGELTKALAGTACIFDCQDWGLDPNQWVDAITAALAEKKAER
jgi:hypothetical protein